MNRSTALQAWLHQQGPLQADQLTSASSDASFRRYYRVATRPGPTPGAACAAQPVWHQASSLIVMDAPPPQEDCRPFVAVADCLRAGGVRAPQVHAADLAQGFLLLEDFGDQTLLAALGAGQAADPLYREALDVLCRLQAISSGTLPGYDLARLRNEVELFPTWYLDRHLQRPLDPAGLQVWQQTTELLLQACMAQPQVLVHRDYHSRNLMVQASGLGVLDFQDAVIGPITYDLVSLLRDAYIDFPEDQQIDWLVRWWQQARATGLPVGDDFGALYRDFEWMGVQRQLKVLGIFARLHHRDGKSAYLASLPRVLGYLESACARYNELRPLGRLIASQHDALREGLSF